MTRTEIEVEPSVLSNLCSEMPCAKIDCRECAAHTLRPGDELVLRIKRPIKPTGKIQVGS